MKPVCQIVRCRPLAPNRRAGASNRSHGRRPPCSAWRLLIRATEPGRENGTGYQHPVHEASQLRQRGEEPSVAGDPAQGVRVAVVHLAPDEPGAGPLVAVELGGGDAGSRLGTGQIGCWHDPSGRLASPVGTGPASARAGEPPEPRTPHPGPAHNRLPAPNRATCTRGRSTVTSSPGRRPSGLLVNGRLDLRLCRAGSRRNGRWSTRPAVWVKRCRKVVLSCGYRGSHLVTGSSRSRDPRSTGEQRQSDGAHHLGQRSEVVTRLESRRDRFTDHAGVATEGLQDGTTALDHCQRHTGREAL